MRDFTDIVDVNRRDKMKAQILKKRCLNAWFKQMVTKKRLWGLEKGKEKYFGR